MSVHYLENTIENRFYEIGLVDDLVKVRYGIIGKPCLVFEIFINSETQQRFPEIVNRIQKNWEERGFIVAKKKEIIDGSIAGVLYTDDIREHPIYSQFLSDTPYDFFYEGENNKILHFKNGLHFDGDLDLSVFVIIGISNVGLIVEGDITVTGLLLAEMNMTVFGNVKAKSLFKEMSHVVIRGDLAVEQTVWGEYNDGMLKVTGNVSGEVWLSNDQDMHAEGELKMKSLYTYNDLDGSSIPDWINPDLFYFEDNRFSFDEKKAELLIKDGKSFLK